MTDHQTTHTPGCRSWGPKHYECAVEQVKRLTERVAELEREIAAKQAHIDALMIEYCPDEMTPEQVAEWARHQQPVSEQEDDGSLTVVIENPQLG